MKIPFQPLPDAEEPLTLEQFVARVKHDPDFAVLMRRHYEAALALPPARTRRTCNAKPAAALQKLKHLLGAYQAQRALTKCVRLMEQDPNLEDPALPARLSTLASEAIDHLLDVQEPERSQLMDRATKIQSLIGKLQAQG